MRLFLAQKAFLDDYARLRKLLDPYVCCRWRDEASLHATVLFTGERFAAEAIVDAVQPLRPVLAEASLTGIGRFSHNRILFAAGMHPDLIRLHREIATALNVEPQQEYITHVTLMRYKKIDTDGFRHVQKQLRDQVVGKMAGPLMLMKSTLTPEGAVYETLHTF